MLYSFTHYGRYPVECSAVSESLRRLGVGAVAQISVATRGELTILSYGFNEPESPIAKKMFHHWIRTLFFAISATRE